MTPTQFVVEQCAGAKQEWVHVELHLKSDNQMDQRVNIQYIINPRYNTL